MATATISHQPDRLSELSAAVGVDKTREEYLKLFSRVCYSPQYDRPYSSPVPGFYDAINSSTSLILLNQRFKYSHIREQVLPEELPNSPQKEYEYESIIEPEPPKSKHTHKVSSARVPVDPYRHFESLSQTKQRPSVSLSHRSQSALVRKDKSQTDPLFTESLCQYYCDVLKKSKRSEHDLQQRPVKVSPNRSLKQNRIRRKSPLTKGQQIYLLGKCHIYDTTDTKLRRTNTYSELLNNRFKADVHCKPQFRLNDPRDYFKYAKFLRTPRPLTSSSMSIRPNNPKKQPATPDLRKSMSFNNTNNSITVRLRQEPKQIATISVQN